MGNRPPGKPGGRFCGVEKQTDAIKPMLYI
jgi:hypothetical protein